MAALAAAGAAWVSSGTVAVDATGARIGLLPADAWHISVSIAAGLLVLAIGLGTRAPRRVAIGLSPLLLLFVPWLPVRLPSALLVWTGPVVTLIWVTVAIALAPGDRIRSLTHRPRADLLVVGAISFAVFLGSWGLVSPSLPAGDEPHYLVITQSLLYDGDLRIENNHRRGDYRAYVQGDLRPDSLRRGRNGQIYSIHAPGVPALVLPAFAIGGYRGVVVFLVLLSSAGCMLAWWLAWRVTGSVAAAWFGWAAIALTPAFLLESFTVYPDGPAATVIATGFWALLRTEWERDRRSWRPWLLHGAALAGLPWMHTRFAVLAATLGGLILLRLARGANPAAKAIAFLSVPAASAVAWLAFFLVIYGTPDPSAPYGSLIQNSFAYLPDGIGGLLFDQGFGLIATSPVLLVALAGLRRVPRLALEWIVVAIPYLASVTTFAMWWAGWSGPARFAIPLILPLAIPAACLWTSATHPATRACAAAALVATCWLTAVVVGVGGGSVAYHSRNEAGATVAQWMEWAMPAIDAPAATPAFVPEPFGTPVAARQIAARDGFLVLSPWIVFLGAAVFVVRAAAVRGVTGRTALTATIAICFGIATPAALAAGWYVRGVDPLPTASADTSMLRTLGLERVVALDLSHRRRLTRDEVIARVAIDVVPRHVEGPSARFNQTLAVIPLLPAGEYTVEAKRLGGDGWLMVGVGADQFSLATEPASRFDGGVRLTLPVDVQTLVVRADEEARQQIELVSVRASHVLPFSAKPTRAEARRAVRYGESTVFFLDDRAFPEPGAFWVSGERSAATVIATDRPRTSQSLVLRNAPVQNVVTIAAGEWRQTMAMGPGDERRVDVPIDPARRSVLVRIESSAGFRPSEAEPGSRDSRFLGVYVRVGA